MTYRPMGCNTLAFQYCQPKVDQICLHLSGRDKNMQCCEINILPDGLYCNNSVHSKTANVKLIKYSNTCTTVCGGWRFSGKKLPVNTHVNNIIPYVLIERIKRKAYTYQLSVCCCCLKGIRLALHGEICRLTVRKRKLQAPL